MQNKANAGLKVFGFAIHPKGMQLKPHCFMFFSDLDWVKYILLYSQFAEQHGGTAARASSSKLYGSHFNPEHDLVQIYRTLHVVPYPFRLLYGALLSLNLRIMPVGGLAVLNFSGPKRVCIWTSILFQVRPGLGHAAIANLTRIRRLLKMYESINYLVDGACYVHYPMASPVYKIILIQTCGEYNVVYKSKCNLRFLAAGRFRCNLKYKTYYFVAVIYCIRLVHKIILTNHLVWLYCWSRCSCWIVFCHLRIRCLAVWVEHTY